MSTGTSEDEYGNKWWYKGGSFHRTFTGLVKEDGVEIYYENGKWHRLDGPAYIDDKRGYCAYYYNGNVHRLCGPARIWVKTANNNYYDPEWYIMGKHIKVNSQEEFERSYKYREWKLKCFR